MHYDTTLPQAVAKLDQLVDEWRQLLADMSHTANDPGSQANRLQSLALDALETEISSTIGSVKYKRSQARDLAEQQRDQDAEQAAQLQRDTAAAATRERLRQLSTCQRLVNQDDATSHCEREQFHTGACQTGVQLQAAQERRDAGASTTA